MAHLFAVVCGLDSMLVGEAQILGQVRAAYKLANTEGSTGRSLSVLFREALRVGKRAHSETRIDEAAASLVGVAVDTAREALGDLGGRSVLLVGAGSTGALAGHVLARAGVGAVTVANRTPERGQRLAAALNGTAIGLDDDELSGAIAGADVVVTATGLHRTCAACRRSPGRARAVVPTRGVRRTNTRWCCSTSPCRATSIPLSASCPA